MTTSGKILCDTSALIEYFDGNPLFSFVGNLVFNDLLVINEVVLTEFLPSLIKDEIFRIAAIANKIERIPMNINWKEISDYKIMLMKNGHPRVGILDLLIAQNCIQNDVEVISHDKHFEVMAKFLPLKLYKA